MDGWLDWERKHNNHMMLVIYEVTAEAIVMRNWFLSQKLHRKGHMMINDKYNLSLHTQ